MTGGNFSQPLTFYVAMNTSPKILKYFGAPPYIPHLCIFHVPWLYFLFNIFKSATLPPSPKVFKKESEQILEISHHPNHKSRSLQRTKFLHTHTHTYMLLYLFSLNGIISWRQLFLILFIYLFGPEAQEQEFSGFIFSQILRWWIIWVFIRKGWKFRTQTLY